jgi:CPA1 family monovalent cation:H+ antiporter
LIGNHEHLLSHGRSTGKHLDIFWELIDEILNAVLFVMIGLEVLLLDRRPIVLLLALLMIPAVLAVRMISVATPITILRRVRTFPHGTIAMMTWGGLRGGISIALALTLPASPYRDMILLVTYIVVVFSILVQGLTIGRLADRLKRSG